MLTLNDGRKDLYQWDIGRKASVSVDCDEVHFAHLNYADSLPVKVVDGEVEIPNQLLTVAMPLLCWAFVEDADGYYTKQTQTIEVLRRAKPADYLYTPTEVISVKDAVNQGLEEAKASGEFDGEKGDKGDKGEDGKSAYEIAVESGKFEGTEEEWLEYLERAQSEKIAEERDSALNEIMRATGDAHDGIESHLGYALSEISSARDQSMEEIHNAKQEAINEISENIVQTTGTDETVVMSQKASSNAFTNALKGAASGKSIVITDTSPIEHEMDVRVRSKNLLDVSTANMITNAAADVLTKERTGTGIKATTPKGASFYVRAGFLIGSTEEMRGKTYTVSYGNCALTGITEQGDIRVIIHNTNEYVGGDEGKRFKTIATASSGQTSLTFTIPQDADISYPYVGVLFGISKDKEVAAGATSEYGNIQLEEGSTATAYAPYIEDISTVKVKKYGKNLLDVSKAVNSSLVRNENGTYVFTKSSTGRFSAQVPIFIPKGCPICVTVFDFVDTTAYSLKFKLHYEDGTSTTFGLLVGNKIITERMFRSIFKNVVGVTLFLDVLDANGTYVSFSDLQIEFGEAFTGFEPYKEPIEYPVSVDGTVEGVTPIYPTTTLVTDTEGAVIDCTYNRDINKAFAELQSIVNTLVGG